MRTPFSATLVKLQDSTALAQEWLNLEARSEGPFFLSWLWLGTLIKHLPSELRPDVFRVVGPNGPVVMGLVFRSKPRWRNLFPVPSIHLNETGDGRFDQICTEYNGLLVERSEEPATDIQSMGWLIEAAGRWGRFYLSGVPARFAEAMAREMQATLDIHSVKSTYCVDFRSMAAPSVAFIDTLGRSTRASLRRSLRFYGQRGALSLSVARTPDEALAYFDEMVALHQPHWKARGQSGAFSDPWVVNFHRDVIAAGTAQGAVWMTRVLSGRKTLGILYNFRWRYSVLNYQSGLAYESGRDARPGMVAHYLAIEHARANGATCYDFMAGENRLKRELGRRGENLVWAHFRRDELLRRVDRIGESAIRWLSKEGKRLGLHRGAV